MNSPDAIVIGPGQSGLAAAHSLLARGLRPVVDFAVHTPTQHSAHRC
ncbi:MAG: hypothetical protein QOI36_4008 [Pseudonocardiales bacterium]|jgi:putative flavoprotein involved in K+ transport|nr:hypothetical protein [Pseudonocardia sp.]MDT7652602.1 hypothetical protein [Pseudonocardiales bacterium]